MLLTYHGIPYAAAVVQQRYPFRVHITEQKPVTMSFRGKSYTPSWPTIEVTETEETVTFLGRQAKVKQCQVNLTPQPPVEMTYRGVRYTH